MSLHADEERRIREAVASTPAGAGLHIVEQSERGVVLEIPAAHPRVGPLTIVVDPDEITVHAGPAHAHFERVDEASERDHVEQAIELVQAILADRMILWSCLGAGGVYLERTPARFRLPWPVRRYRWSGPVER